MIITLNNSNIESVTECLLAGGIIAFFTDTLFALSCDARNTEASEKLFNMKQRPHETTAPVLCANRKMAQKYASFSPELELLADQFWPGMLSIIGQSTTEAQEISRFCTMEGTISLRVPSHEDAQAILQHCKIPLIGTSCNISGSGNLTTADQIYSVFGEHINFVIAPKNEIKPVNTGSTIIKQDADKLVLIREGAIMANEIKKHLESKTGNSRKFSIVKHNS